MVSVAEAGGLGHAATAADLAARPGCGLRAGAQLARSIGGQMVFDPAALPPVRSAPYAGGCSARWARCRCAKLELVRCGLRVDPARSAHRRLGGPLGGFDDRAAGHQRRRRAPSNVDQHHPAPAGVTAHVEGVTQTLVSAGYRGWCQLGGGLEVLGARLASPADGPRVAEEALELAMALQCRAARWTCC